MQKFAEIFLNDVTSRPEYYCVRKAGEIEIQLKCT